MSFEFYFLTFLVIFLLNLLPVFGPPTWMVLSFISFTYPLSSIPLFIGVAICASTSGRFVLMLFSKEIIRNRLMGKRYVQNIERLRMRLERNKRIISGVFLIEAFTPLPSDQFFVAYGLTGMKARYALIPFAIGRIATYSFWVYLATETSTRIARDSLLNFSFFSWSFIFLEGLIFLLIYLFVKIDWEYFVLYRRIKFIRGKNG